MARRPLDEYDTPPHYLKALFDVIGTPQGGVYEPCCGSGNIVEALRGAGVSRKQIVTNDLNPDYGETHFDAALDDAWYDVVGVSWCITNPPFSDEQAILERALKACPNVAMLARLSFLEPTISRTEFWKRHAFGMELIVLPRYSFVGSGSDTQTCIWMIWRREPNPTVLTQINFCGKDGFLL